MMMLNSASLALGLFQINIFHCPLRKFHVTVPWQPKFNIAKTGLFNFPWELLFLASVSTS
jgi:hypothetical protein